jgi:Holliday junction resolvase RusA-like endonuclease
MFSFKATVQGHCQSKSNGSIKTRYGIVKSKSARAFEHAFLWQAKTWDIPKIPYEGLVIMTCRLYYPTRKNDLDNTLLKDLIQKAGIIKNDRQIRGEYNFWGLEKSEPYCDFWLEGIESEEVIDKLWKIEVDKFARS